MTIVNLTNITSVCKDHNQLTIYIVSTHNVCRPVFMFQYYQSNIKYCMYKYFSKLNNQVIPFRNKNTSNL